MFTILIFQFEEAIKRDLKEICSGIGYIRILEGSMADELDSLIQEHHIDCFFFCLDTHFDEITHCISTLRKIKKYHYTPLFLFSSKIERLVSAFTHWKTCEFFLLPISDERRTVLANLLRHYDTIHQKIHPDTPAHFRISTGKGVYNIPYAEILFVESTMKKSVIHTRSGMISLPTPLYRVRKLLPETAFIQTHRSFIINLKNACFMDKTKEPWVISFPQYDKAAFVSRSYRKEVLETVFSDTEDISD